MAQTIGPASYPNGNPVQTNQVNQTQQVMQSAVANGVQGNLNAMPSDQELSQSLQTAGGQLATQQTPQSRQSYVDNTPLPAMQQNYDDLASKLAHYDQAVLSPQFQYTNPGTPSDAPAFGRVEKSSLSQLTPESAALPADKGLFNTNPEYAMSSQIAQGNSIVDLLNALNTSIGKQFDLGTRGYTSTVDSQKGLIDSILKVMGLKNDLAMKQAELASRSGKKTLAQQKQEAVQEIMDYLNPLKGKDGFVSPDDYAYAKTQAQYLGLDPTTFDKEFRRYRNQANSYYQVEPSSLTTDERKTIQTRDDAVKSGQNFISSLDQVYNDFSKMNVFEKGIPLDVAAKFPILAPHKAALNTQFFLGMEENLRKSIVGGRVTQQEIKWIKDAVLPKEFDTNESYKLRVDKAKQEIANKINDPNHTIGSSSGGGGSETRTLNGATYQKVNGGWQKVK